MRRSHIFFLLGFLAALLTVYTYIAFPPGTAQPVLFSIFGRDYTLAETRFWTLMLTVGLLGLGGYYYTSVEKKGK